jgi:hypothetical protein
LLIDWKTLYFLTLKESAALHRSRKLQGATRFLSFPMNFGKARGKLVIACSLFLSKTFVADDVSVTPTGKFFGS